MMYNSLLIVLAMSSLLGFFLKRRDPRMLFNALLIFTITLFLLPFKELFKIMIYEVLKTKVYTLYWYLFMSQLNLIMSIYFRKTSLKTNILLQSVTLLQSLVFFFAVVEFSLLKFIGLPTLDLFYTLINDKLLLTLLSHSEIILIWMSYGRVSIDFDLGCDAFKDDLRRNKSLLSQARA